MKKKGHSRRSQRGGASGLYIIEVEFYKNNQKLNTKSLQDQNDPLFDEIDMLWNTIHKYLKEKGLDPAELDDVEEHEDEVETYPPQSASLMDYEGDGDPKLPRPIKVNVPGHGDIVVKFVKLKKVGEADDPGQMDADPNYPVGAGAGPGPGPAGAGAGAAAAGAGAGAAGAGPGPAAPRGDPSRPSTPTSDQEMAGGKKKRRVRSKTRKHKKRHGTRRRY